MVEGEYSAIDLFGGKEVVREKVIAYINRIATQTSKPLREIAEETSLSERRLHNVLRKNNSFFSFDEISLLSFVLSLDFTEPLGIPKYNNGQLEYWVEQARGRFSLGKDTPETREEMTRVYVSYRAVMEATK